MAQKTNKFKRTDQDDPEFMALVSKYFEVMRLYFRYQVKGLKKLPQQGSALIVMNHGIIPYHGFLLAKKVFDQMHRTARGLGASFLFEVPLLREFFIKAGAVDANPKNAEKLLKEDNLVMLSPGGIYEALVTQPGMKRIPWERRMGFVKMAIKTGTPIIPTYCRGIDKVYLNSEFLLKKRIKILEKTRFSLPIFMGIGLLPFPYKLTHYIGDPISVKAKRGEELSKQTKRIHQEVIDAMEELQRRHHYRKK